MLSFWERVKWEVWNEETLEVLGFIIFILLLAYADGIRYLR